MFEWKTEYETGISFMDEQRKKVFELGSEASKFQQNYNTLTLSEYTKVFSNLVEYIKFSFSVEEDFLSEKEYVDFNYHREQHKFFLKRLSYLDLNDYEDCIDDYFFKVLEFIFTWLDKHLILEDSKYLIWQ